jgi:ferritin-like metal-binding protein YciE
MGDFLSFTGNGKSPTAFHSAELIVSDALGCGNSSNCLCSDARYLVRAEPTTPFFIDRKFPFLTNLELPMAEKDLSVLFLDTLKDIYYAEKQIYKSLPKMAKSANSDRLRAAFEKHHDETEGQIERLKKIFELLGAPARGKKCDAIEGILDEGNEIMSEYKGEPALDAGLLAAAQAVEHYEISRYGTLKNWAVKLNMKDAVKLLDQTLAEEKKTDDTLTKLADTEVNAEAA